MENTNKMTERRENLKKTSKAVKELMEAGKIKATNLNDALLESYNGKKKNQVWLTLELWQTAGYSVRKGETAQMIWGKNCFKTSQHNHKCLPLSKENLILLVISQKTSY